MANKEGWDRLIADIRKIADDLDKYVAQPTLAGKRPTIAVEASFFARFEMLSEDLNDLYFESPLRSMAEVDAADDDVHARRARAKSTGEHPYADIFAEMGVEFYD